MPLVLLFWFVLQLPADDTVLKAFEHYEKGNQSLNYAERRNGYNEALALFMSASPEMPSNQPLLNAAIADTFYQLGEYPWAILYFQRALKSGIDYSSIKDPLNKTKEKLGLVSLQASPLSFSQKWVFPEKCAILFWISIFFLILLSALIWVKNKSLRKGVLSGLGFSIFLILTIGFFSLFSPIEAIVMEPSGLFREPIESEILVQQEPLLAGSKVNILHMSSDGKWFKVKDENQLVGYLPSSIIRVI